LANDTRLEGADALDATLQDIPSLVKKDALRRSLVRVLEPFAERVKANTPYLTGTLRRSMTVGGHEKLTPRQQGIAKDQQPREFEEHIHFGTADPAGIMKEFGNVNQEAEPFFRQAWEGSKESLVREVGSDVGEKIEAGASSIASRNRGKG
jgi:HK97 gp10 family phage protein